MVGHPFDLEGRMGLSVRLEQTVRVSVALYRMKMAAIIGRPLEDVFPLYYPGMPAYDTARSILFNGGSNG